MMQSVDESVAVGAWVTFHLLVDTKNKLLRGSIRHWFRITLFHDLNSRLGQVQKLEGERKEVLEKIGALENIRLEYDQKERSLKEEATNQRVRAER